MLVLWKGMTKSASILLVEDNPADVVLMGEAIADRDIELHVVGGGADAFAFLTGQRPYQGQRRPDLIVLDLNLPDMSGKDVLAGIKSDLDMRSIPVIIFSSSRARSDVSETYELGANSYMQKPLELESYRDAVRSMEHYWFSVAHLPPTPVMGHA